MADPIQSCNCIPHENICCCGPESGISVVQPTCQTLPDGRVVNNPAFAAIPSISYWSYKFFTDCGTETQAITTIAIPVCETLTAESVAVFEKIDGCGQFVSVPFTLAKTSPGFGTAEDGYQWLLVNSDNRYGKGVCVELQIQLTGNFPTAVQAIKVNAATNVLTFDCGCFLVPRCNPQGQLTVIKRCSRTIVENQVTLNYEVNVTNNGNAALPNVQYLDTVFIPSTLGLGTITVTPVSLNVNTSVPGQITISGNLGTITPGGQINITYTIPITSIPSPELYVINNTAMASAAGTMDISSCTTEFEAVEVNTTKCCTIAGNRGSFTITLASVAQSPTTNVNVEDHLMIPNGVTVQFTSFGGCDAVFSSGGGPVPLNTNISGPVDITISCNNVLVPAGGSISKTVTFTIVSSTLFGTAVIQNMVNIVTPTNPDSQVFLSAGQLPVQSNIDVSLNLVCRNPCS